ncbi:ferritin-like domain-containing protein [Oligoflexus tunisiensis]|uniref:ferritin-like domain-containing protein n=1 Tax=Oligoflexus tunisiensis TaxID=708132 RepID=UPI00114D1F6B|nr:ferritin-like domain-containing protein [Oligoflexus tunisiensis]
MSVNEKSYQNKDVLELLGKIYSLEIAGVTRYLHYSFMIMGYNRIPIQSWFRSNANESMQHAIIIGEKITSLGGHPPMVASRVDEMNNHSVSQLLSESLTFEGEALVHYKELVKLAVKLEDIALEELARGLVREEMEHADEVRKMLTAPT